MSSPEIIWDIEHIWIPVTQSMNVLVEPENYIEMDRAKSRQVISWKFETGWVKDPLPEVTL